MALESFFKRFTLKNVANQQCGTNAASHCCEKDFEWIPLTLHPQEPCEWFCPRENHVKMLSLRFCMQFRFHDHFLPMYK